MTRRTLTVTCGTHRHPQDVPVSSIAMLEDDLEMSWGKYQHETIVLTLKPKRWIQDTWGDRQWHGTVCADRAIIAKLLRGF